MVKAWVEEIAGPPFPTSYRRPCGRSWMPGTTTATSESRRAAWVDDYGPFSRAAGVPEKVIDGAAKLEDLPATLAGAPVWVANAWRHAPRAVVRLATVASETWKLAESDDGT